MSRKQKQRGGRKPIRVRLNNMPRNNPEACHVDEVLSAHEQYLQKVGRRQVQNEVHRHKWKFLRYSDDERHVVLACNGKKCSEYRVILRADV